MKQDANINIFERLLSEKINLFVNHFKKESTRLFYDENNKVLIHPGEYGLYREKICKEFLRNFTPLQYDFGTGFVINSYNEISSQCDIIIYDPRFTPLIQASELQTFYPVESIVAIGEVKSTLSKQNCISALEKLSKIKKMREKIKHPVICDPKEPKKSYDPKNYHYDQVFTFLICEKLDFRYEKLANELNEIYEKKNIDVTHRHNLILSIDDGLICYRDNNNTAMMYPLHNEKQLKNSIMTAENKDIYFKTFASYFFIGTSGTRRLFPEISDYMGSIQGARFINET